MSGKLFEWVMDRAELMGEPTPGVSLVELVGDRRVLIENHYGVTSYDRKCVCIKTTYGIMSVSGENLELTSMSKQQLVITGCIAGISIYRGRK